MPVSGGGHRAYDPVRLRRDSLELDVGIASPRGPFRRTLRNMTNKLVKPKEYNKDRALSREDIKHICQKLDHTGVRYALIGGAAFVMRGIEGYKTTDIDVAALAKIEDHGFEELDCKNAGVGTDPNGHYLINGVKVDWMYRLDDGSGPLFKHAVEFSSTIEGVPVASIASSMAIKVNAGRAKDVSVFYDFIRRDLINPRKVLKLIDMYVEPVEEKSDA